MKWSFPSLLLSLLLSVVRGHRIAPKVMILSMLTLASGRKFDGEADVWYNIPEFDVLTRNITIPGLSPLFPQVHCTKDGDICQLTLGEGEINAASSVAALVHSKDTSLEETYFLIAAIAGVNPKIATIGSVTFAQYAVQVGLQYEIDARQIPANFSTGYFGQGSTAPGQFPVFIYGTEVFEVNDSLRKLAANAAKAAKLNDTADAQQMRAQYAQNPDFAAANNVSGPSIVLCDTATSDTFWDGDLLGDSFDNTTKLWTNGSATYCTTQQEDSATLNALMRGAMTKLVDFSRVIVMRSASDWDRQGPGMTVVDQLLGPTPGFNPALLNLHLAGVKVVEMIVNGWDDQFSRGVNATNYIGDIFGSLGGVPDFSFGPAS
ncbi:Purine nucleoside permease [Mycena sanguinolenta]|uniref:Purine nucleoside permease n=1 Tax=Mycena sanguinolenta TaxID=230812 RepID=A0A8H6XRN2_9AGAR|nr:Purine nucleoside permease [Mycena sanguinolenta]